MVIGELLATVEVRQEALLVIWQTTTSPFEGVLLKLAPVATVMPFTVHTYDGAVPPPTGTAV
jgi:hypothetical protein